MIITVCNGKGGVGKSTVSVLLSLLLNQANQSTGLIDRDPQGTATYWLKNLGQEQAHPGGNYEHHVIDTPPQLSSPMFTESVRQADRIVVVCSASPTDLWTTKDTVAAIEAFKQPHAKLLLLFNRIKGGTTLAKGIERLAAQIGTERIPGFLSDRQAFQHAAIYGIDGLTDEALAELSSAAKAILA
jgi:cellulose biosynthesis protein BcsQ